MTIDDVSMLAVHALAFACGYALLSYKVYASYRERFGEILGLKSHIPGVVGTALMLLAILSASSTGWISAIVTVVAGYWLSRVCVSLYQWRLEAAIVGPALGLLLAVR